MRLKRKLRLLVAAQLLLLVGAVAFLTWTDAVIGGYGDGRVYTNLKGVAAADAALVLGTAKYVAAGRPNLFYTTRMRAAADLYHAGKVRGIVVSGDNSTYRYNEPRRMMKDLIELGVPSEHITPDYAGFRTLDSIVRMGAVFGLKSYVVVSQGFHVRRALYIADAHGHNAIGFATAEMPGGMGYAVRFREIFARAMAVVDVNVLGRGPKFLGKPEPVGLKPL